DGAVTFALPDLRDRTVIGTGNGVTIGSHPGANFTTVTAAELPTAFASPTFPLAAFGASAGGWSSDDTYPRKGADVSGDGMADIVGFSSAGVFESRATEAQEGNLWPPRSSLPPSVPTPAAGAATTPIRARLRTLTATTWPTSSASARTVSLCRSPPEAATLRPPRSSLPPSVPTPAPAA